MHTINNILIYIQFWFRIGDRLIENWKNLLYYNKKVAEYCVQ